LQNEFKTVWDLKSALVFRVADRVVHPALGERLALLRGVGG